MVLIDKLIDWCQFFICEPVVDNACHTYDFILLKISKDKIKTFIEDPTDTFSAKLGSKIGSVVSGEIINIWWQ